MSDDRDPSAEAPDAKDAIKSDEDLSPSEALKKGMGLLWRAAKSAADEIQREIDVDAVKSTLKRAGHDIEVAAHDAAKALESLVDRAAPKDPKPPYTEAWPPPDNAPEAKRADADIPEDGGTDEEGRRRDMRIQVED